MQAIVAILLCVCVSAAWADSCSWFSPQGTLFNLSSLTRPSASPYRAEDESFYYAINVCDVSLGLGPSNRECGLRGGAVCQYGKRAPPDGHVPDLATADGPFVALLAVWRDPNWSLIEPSNPTAGLQVAFANGDFCFVGAKQESRVVTLRFPCDPSADDAHATFTTSRVGCSHLFVMPSTAACAAVAPLSKHAMSAGGILMITLCVVLVCYFVGGYFYNMYTSGLRGLAACPHVEFWADAFGAIRDVGTGLCATACRLWHQRSSRSYAEASDGL